VKEKEKEKETVLIAVGEKTTKIDTILQF